ncbi:TolC family outer membrane protein [Sphingomonas sp. CFBP 13720]|uniref:TolC family outer membrane protein n=1 Tax=Sphingomonas sp. CFBP 13720 TaxID=2775302 RepID=UPI0017826C9C|nr:TolC family outer membrane protein [Sphingomonas sp. CFBP 13720]MBD8679976.1 TolC family outer membrane protein [Sphingomonas sp. CFBP 13720]
MTAGLRSRIALCLTASIAIIGEAAVAQAPRTTAAPVQPATPPMPSLPVDPAARTETLAEALADAYRNNPQLEAQRAQLRAIDETVIQASSPYRLRSSVVGSIRYQEQVQRNVFFDDLVTNRNRATGASLTASQILFNGGRTAAQVSAAEADVLSGRERLREVENFILFEVVDSYMSVLRDQTLIAIQRRSVDSYARQVDQARARERAGDLTRTDIAQAEAQLGIVQAQLSQAEANLQRSRARFAAAVGRNPGNLTPPAPLPGIPASIDMAFRDAEAESPTLWQAILNERAGRARVAAERAERNPVLSADAAIGLNDNTAIGFNNLRRGASASATLTVPLLTGGVVDSRVRAALANQQALQFNVEATRRGVSSQVQSAWNQTISSAEQQLIGLRSVEAANRALEGVRRGFQEGFRSNFEVLDSEQRLLNAQLLVANADYQRYSSQATLLTYIGRLETALLSPANATYDATRNLERQKAKQIDPFQPVVSVLDRLARAPDDPRDAPLVPVAGPTILGTPLNPAPQRPLGTALPLPDAPRTRPLPPEDQAPPSTRRPVAVPGEQ